MTREEARNMLVAKMICLTRETSGTDVECNSHNCENCDLNYDQGNMGEQKEALEIAVKALEQQPTCESCKYYTYKQGYRESKNHRYCNRRATTKMLPSDYCSRWEVKADADSD